MTSVPRSHFRSLIPYIAVSFANIALEYVHIDIGIAATKALLMPALLYFMITRTKQKPLWIIMALFFSWLGDLFLLKSMIPIRFMLGLGSFLLAHVCYISYFIKEIKISKKPFYNTFLWLVLLFWIAMMSVLLQHTGDFSLPVALYAAIILTMLYLAITRKESVTRSSFLWVLGGATLFVLSDSMIAFNKFVVEIPLARVLIMVTYLAGQAAIINGVTDAYKES